MELTILATLHRQVKLSIVQSDILNCWRCRSELLKEGTAKPKGIKVLTPVERLSAVRIKSHSIQQMLTKVSNGPSLNWSGLVALVRSRVVFGLVRDSRMVGLVRSTNWFFHEVLE